MERSISPTRHAKGIGMTRLATASQLSTLAEWAADHRGMAIPDAVLRQAAIVLCDDLGAIVSAAEDPLLSALSEQLLRDGGKSEATVFRHGRPRTDRYNAALANGAAAPWNELDGGSLRVSCHAGTYALPALLAEAEAEGLSVRETLRSLVVAYEVVTRIALAFGQPKLDLHPHALFAALGAAAAVCAARRYDGVHFFDALTIAATCAAPGPFGYAAKGSFVRNMWVGIGSWAGLRAADWARCGLTGLPEAPRDVFNGVFRTEYDPDRLVTGLGSEWQIEHRFHKIYPCCQFAHSTVEAICDLLQKLPPDRDARNCERLVIEVHEKGRLLDVPQPATVLAARFSIPHIAAVAVAHGHVDTETLGAGSLVDPAVVALRERVVIAPYEPVLPPPNDRPARVSLVFADGAKFQAECLCARGSPGRPFDFATLREKLTGICHDIYPGMPGVMDRLAASDAAALDATWDETVTLIAVAAAVGSKG